MTNEVEIKYFGWSCFSIAADSGNLLFDPFFRPMHGARWASLEDFRNTGVICITHGHYEHYLDAYRIVNLTGARVVGSKDICNHLNFKYHVPKQNLIPITLNQEVDVSGFKITSFEWQHRNISFWKFFKGNFTTASQFVWYSLFRSPFNAPKFGYYIEGGKGLRLMNYNEGFSNLMDIKQVSELGQKFKPNVLLAGMQLNFEEYLGNGAAALAPETVILFHPHEKLFEKFKLKSSSPQAFFESVKSKLSKAQIIIAKPMDSIRIPQTN